eukprot:5638868-Amphidinium_carterae.3
MGTAPSGGSGVSRLRFAKLATRENGARHGPSVLHCSVGVQHAGGVASVVHLHLPWDRVCTHHQPSLKHHLKVNREGVRPHKLVLAKAFSDALPTRPNSYGNKPQLDPMTTQSTLQTEPRAW